MTGISRRETAEAVRATSLLWLAGGVCANAGWWVARQALTWCRGIFSLPHWPLFNKETLHPLAAGLATPEVGGGLRAKRTQQPSRHLRVREAVLPWAPGSVPDDLRRLNLSDNDLSALPGGLEGATNLEGLVVSQNEMTDLSFAGSFERLLTLNASHNGATEFNLNAPSLIELDLNGNSLGDELDCANFPALRRLRLRDNRLSRPPRLANPGLLRHLDLSACPLGPASYALFQGYTGLRQLHLVAARLSRLPELKSCSYLTLLDLRRNQIGKIADSLPPGAAQRRVDLRGNPIRALNAEAWAMRERGIDIVLNDGVDALWAEAALCAALEAPPDARDEALLKVAEQAALLTDASRQLLVDALLDLEEGEAARALCAQWADSRKSWEERYARAFACLARTFAASGQTTQILGALESADQHGSRGEWPFALALYWRDIADAGRGADDGSLESAFCYALRAARLSPNNAFFTRECLDLAERRACIARDQGDSRLELLIWRRVREAGIHPSAARKLGLAAVHHERWEEGLEPLAWAVEHESATSEVRNAYANALLEVAHAHLTAGSTESALERLRDAETAYPSLFTAGEDTPLGQKARQCLLNALCDPKALAEIPIAIATSRLADAENLRLRDAASILKIVAAQHVLGYDIRTCQMLYEYRDTLGPRRTAEELLKIHSFWFDARQISLCTKHAAPSIRALFKEHPSIVEGVNWRSIVDLHQYVMSVYTSRHCGHALEAVIRQGGVSEEVERTAKELVVHLLEDPNLTEDGAQRERVEAICLNVFELLNVYDQRLSWLWGRKSSAEEEQFSEQRVKVRQLAARLLAGAFFGSPDSLCASEDFVAWSVTPPADKPTRLIDCSERCWKIATSMT